MILEEFDSNKKAVVEVYDLVKPIENFPKVAVSCFAHVTLDRLVNELDGKVIAKINVANMEIPIYKAMYKGIEVALFMSYVGAAGCVAVIEETFAMGAEKLILFGTCGVLDALIEDCSIIIPNKAVRDEGTSFHYAKASDEIEVNKKYIDEFVDILKEFNCHYTVVAREILKKYIYFRFLLTSNIMNYIIRK